jgi:hypothetical protein
MDFSEGLAWRQDRETGKVGFIGTDGRWVIQPQFDCCLSVFRDGLALVMVRRPPADPSAPDAEEWGYDHLLIDRTGKPAAIRDTDEKGRKFYYGSTFSDGLAVIYQNGKCGYANREGKVVIAPQYGSAAPFSERLALVQLKPAANPAEIGTYAYIDTSGKVAISLEGLIVDPGLHQTEFHEGLAPAGREKDKRWGFIGRDGRFVVEPQFREAQMFSEGLAAVSVDFQWGYIDHSGKMVIPPQFVLAGPFREGVASVCTGRAPGGEGNVMFIDITGKVVIPHEKCGTGEGFSEGLAPAYLPGPDGHSGYIDHTGKLVIDFGR